VTLILGPTHLDAPAGVHTIHIESAQQMLDAAMQHAVGCGIIIATAAVSDWRPEQRAEQKVKKTDEDLNVRMVRNPDVLAAIAQRKGESFVVGFAAETREHERNAREKLQRKSLDAIVVNDVSEQRAWGAQPNALTVLWGSDGRQELGEASKIVLAARLLDCIEPLRQAQDER
jgi:phosphopantothenoylcysteine decarboxylase/phosphopantothenate--cysteine ligase